MKMTEEKLKEILDAQRKEYQMLFSEMIIGLQRELWDGLRKEQKTFHGEIKEYYGSKLQLFSGQYDTLIKMNSSLIEDLQIIKADIESIKGSLRKKD